MSITRKDMIEDIARAWASLDGKQNQFDRCKVDPAFEDETGHYEGYIADAEALVFCSPVLEAALTCLENSLNGGSLVSH